MKEAKGHGRPSLWMIMNSDGDKEHAYVTSGRSDMHVHELVGTAPPVVGNGAGKAIRTLDYNEAVLTYLTKNGFVSFRTDLQKRTHTFVQLDEDPTFARLGKIKSISADRASAWIYSISVGVDGSFTIARTSLAEKRTELLQTLVDTGIEALGDSVWVVERNVLLFSCLRKGEYTFATFDPTRMTLDFTAVKDAHLSHWSYHHATHSIYGISVSQKDGNAEAYHLLHIDLDKGAVVKKLGKLGVEGHQMIDTTLDYAFRRYFVLIKHPDDQFRVHAISLKTLQEMDKENIPDLYRGPVYGLEVVHSVKKEGSLSTQ